MAKTKGMFTSQKARNEEATEAAYALVPTVFPNLLELDLNRDQIELVGLAVNPSRGGDGYLAVGKLLIPENRPADDTLAQLSGTRFVTYGFGESVIEAICNIEAQLANGTASIVPDKYAT